MTAVAVGSRPSVQALMEAEIMNRVELKRLWKRSKTERKFRRLLLALLSALVWTKSTPRDQLAACALADYTLRKAGAAGRRDLRRRLAAMGWEFSSRACYALTGLDTFFEHMRLPHRNAGSRQLGFHSALTRAFPCGTCAAPVDAHALPRRRRQNQADSVTLREQFLNSQGFLRTCRGLLQT